MFVFLSLLFLLTSIQSPLSGFQPQVKIKTKPQREQWTPFAPSASMGLVGHLFGRFKRQHPSPQENRATLIVPCSAEETPTTSLLDYVLSPASQSTQNERTFLDSLLLSAIIDEKESASVNITRIQLILAAGANPNTENEAGISVLELAIEKRKTDVVELLLKTEVINRSATNTINENVLSSIWLL